MTYLSTDTDIFIRYGKFIRIFDKLDVPVHIEHVATSWNMVEYDTATRVSSHRWVTVRIKHYWYGTLSSG